MEEPRKRSSRTKPEPVLSYEGGLEPLASRRRRVGHGAVWLMLHSWRGRTSILLGISLVVIAVLVVQQLRLRQELEQVRATADRQIDSTRERIEAVRKDAEEGSIDAARISRDVEPSVFAITAGNAYGTAFAMFEDDGGTLLVTNRHVVGGGSATVGGRVRLLRGRDRRAATIAAVSRRDDVALVRVDERVPVLVGAAGGRSAAQEGDPILAYGSPLGLSDTKTQGIVSALRQDFIQFDAVVHPGSSGGPLLDRRGRVLGIVTGEISEDRSSTGSGLSVAVDIEAACDLLESQLPHVDGC